MRKIFFEFRKLFKISIVFTILIFSNIYFNFAIKFLSFKHILDMSSKEIKWKFRNKININQLIFLQNLINKFMIFNTCLISSLSFYRVCKRLNINAIIVIGICSDKKSFKSHAWIKIDNNAYFDIKDTDYKIIKEFQ